MDRRRADSRAPAATPRVACLLAPIGAPVARPLAPIGAPSREGGRRAHHLHGHARVRRAHARSVARGRRDGGAGGNPPEPPGGPRPPPPAPAGRAAGARAGPTATSATR